MPCRRAQQLTLLCADLVNDAILRQSSFSEIDRYCSPQRQTEILSVVIRFIDLARGRRRGRRASGPHRAIFPCGARCSASARSSARIGFAQIRALWKQLDSEFSDLPRGGRPMRAELTLENCVQRIEGPLLFLERKVEVGLNARVEVVGRDGRDAHRPRRGDR